MDCSTPPSDYPHLRRAIAEFSCLLTREHPAVALLAEDPSAYALSVVDKYFETLYRIRNTCGRKVLRKMKRFGTLPTGLSPKRWLASSQTYSEAKVCWLLECHYHSTVVDVEATSPKRAPGRTGTCDFKVVRGTTTFFTEVKLRGANYERMRPADFPTLKPEESKQLQECNAQEFTPGDINQFASWLQHQLRVASHVGADVLAVSFGWLDVIPCCSVAQVAHYCSPERRGFASQPAGIEFPEMLSGVLLVGPRCDNELVLNPRGDDAVRGALSDAC